jgi:2-polyprenyl-3-methyl-5-hydroxy-6-metoxy-1,4-benzoquinol methylase
MWFAACMGQPPPILVNIMQPEAYVQMNEVQDKHWWFTARRRILHSEIQALGLPSDAQILEIGCGTGANLSLLAEFGKVTGMDMSEMALQMASQRSTPAGVTLFQGLCPADLLTLQGSFDLICLFDVLEHIPDDVGTLKALPRLLKPGGRILLSVPAHQWMWSHHDEHLHHQRRYTKRDLQAAFAQAGLPIVRLTYLNFLLFPLAVAARWFDRLTGRSSPSGLAVPPMPINSLFAALFAAERHLRGRARLPWGLSLLVVATRVD